LIEYNSACFSKGKPDWGTPPELFDYLNRQYRFTLDPCTSKDNPLGIFYFYTKEDDGLKQGWAGSVYCNPPYGSKIIEWLEKGLQELQNCRNIVYLLPARTDTRWFHRYIYNNLTHQPWCWVKYINFLRGRQKMIDMDNPNKKLNTAPFPSMIVVFSNSLK
jgi:phage N-6-adenine-methyltransferase